MSHSSTVTVRVRYGETDQMGFAYHSHYLVWCDIGRTEFIRERGVSYAELERSGVGLAVVEARVRYAAAARYDDLVTIQTRLARVRSRGLTFRYEIRRGAEAGGDSLAAATVRLVAIDGTGRPCRLPGWLLEALPPAEGG